MNPDDQNKLKDRVIIRTYPDYEQDELDDILRSAGICVLSMPMIAVDPLRFMPKKDISDYDWLIFTSKNAVYSFFGQCTVTGTHRIAALGPGTAAALTRVGHPPDFTGTGKSAIHFSEELRQAILPGEHLLLALGTLAPDTLETTLSTSHPVERVNVYQTGMPKLVDRDLLMRVEKDQYDLLIVSSPSAIRNLWTLLSGNKENLRIISIGQTTTAAIRDFHIEPVATAMKPGYQGLAEITINYLLNNYKNHIQ